MGNQAQLALPAVTHRYKRINCLWLGQFQIAEYGLCADGESGRRGVVQNRQFRSYPKSAWERFSGEEQAAGARRLSPTGQGV